MPDGLSWHKSSYSGAHGGNCVEVAEWYKSSYSGNQGGHCVEVADWHKSTHSGGNAGACLELANTPRHIHIRDTQHRDLGHLTFPASSWHAFLSTLKAEDM
ncbi:DUF397 domain-containing protein [Streptomonospora wellingtoniae]|uniref:DUF397 domain-containing protein n=1 Tax=Streptomonospora wellingtoniae TaxID=3075544 RepID=A0ABU2KWF7_9ACTN|nr:DUF397 domain-containing protein [Streptomonospora sp. DSM 45055]MDT0303551.1 DUF397 domain-containing protein [Streptomonospora sp. DSM 45055]